MSLRRLVLILGSLVLVALVAGVLAAPLSVAQRVVAWRFPDVPEVTPEALAARWAAGEPVLVLDARERAEFEVSHLPGARWAGPAGDLAALEPVARDRPVVVYCSVGWRSAQVARGLRERGFERVWNLRGSLFRWANEGRPLVDSEGRPTRVVHPYSAAWSWLLRQPR